MTRAEELAAAIAAFRAMSLCLNPDCETGDRVIPWLDGVYCCHKCRVTHAARSERGPDPLCARRSCGQPAAPRVWLLGGYCSSACEQLDTPAPVEVWAAAMGRAGEVMGFSVADAEAGVADLRAALAPAGAVEPLTPVPVGAETPDVDPDLQETTGLVAWALAPRLKFTPDFEWEDEAFPDRPPSTSQVWTAPPKRPRKVEPHREPDPVPRLRWWARLLRRTA